MLEQAFIIGRGGDDVSTRQDSTPCHIKGGSYGRDSPLTFVSPKCDS